MNYKKEVIHLTNKSVKIPIVKIAICAVSACIICLLIMLAAAAVISGTGNVPYDHSGV